jgi:hypothetical protein
MVSKATIVLVILGIAGAVGFSYYYLKKVKAKEEVKPPEEKRPVIETDKREYTYFEKIKWKASNLAIGKTYGVGIYVKEKEKIYWKSERDKFVAEKSTHKGEYLIEAIPIAPAMPYREGFPGFQVAVIPPGEHKFVLFEVLNGAGTILAETSIKIVKKVGEEVPPPRILPGEEVVSPREVLPKEFQLPYIPPELETRIPL